MHSQRQIRFPAVAALRDAKAVLREIGSREIGRPFPSVCLQAALLLAIAAWDSPARGADPPAGAKVATFSICAADPETGVCGAAVASRYPAVGRVVAYARGGIGAFCTQHHHVPAWGESALDLLAAGKSPQAVLATLLDGDSEPGQRQLGIVNMAGRTAQHNPHDAAAGSRYWGAMTGRYYSCQGNTLAGRQVIAAMAEAYESTPGSLADRLMAALIAGDCAGGDHRGRLAAGIRVAKRGVDGYWLELHVDRSPDAVIDLARSYAELEHDAKGPWRGGRLPFAHPCPDRPLPQPPEMP